jgi:hypothetical protein
MLQSFVDKITIKYNSRDWKNYISKANIPFAKTTTFNFKVVTTGSKEFMIGVGSREVFGVAGGHGHKDCFCYYYYNNTIYENGSSRASGSSTQIANGAALSMEINRNSNTVSWKVGATQLTQATIPESIKNKPLFLVLIFYYQNDELELLASQ